MAQNYYTNNQFLEDRYDFDENVPGSSFVEIFQNVVIALAILVILYLFVVTPNQVNGPSMRETLEHQDLLLTNKLIQVFGGKNSILGDYQRGDIITFHSGSEDLIKRIIAAPGDSLVLKSGKVFVNGQEINEPYLADGTFENESAEPSVIDNKDKTFPQGSWLQEGQEVIIPEDNFFVMGDNRNNSKDSRYDSLKLVKRADMKGKVFFRILPLDHAGFIGSHVYTVNE